MKAIKILSLSLFCCLFIFFDVSGQDRFSVSGTVMDVNGKEIADVNISIKGTTKIAASGIDGHFLIPDVPKDSFLVFTHLNYKTVEIRILEANAKMKVVMDQRVAEQDEVVVVGLGTQRKVTMTGAITNVDPKELQIPATSISNMLAGRVPGIIGVQRSGEPGADFSEFWVRGISTFGASSAALILIDGVEGNLNNVDPSDIESFSILKDASATAVYGVRGANGVVIITTKRGKAGDLKVNLRMNSTYTYSPRMPEYVEAYDYAILANEARLVRGNEAIYTDAELELFKTGLDPDLYPNVNWRDEILKKSSRYDQYNLNIAGGGTNARYFMSFGYLNKEGMFKQDASAHTYDVNTNYRKYNFRANIDVDLTRTTKLSLLMDDALVMQGAPAYESSNGYLWSSQANITPVSVPARFSTGELAGYGGNGAALTPYYLLNYTGFRKINDNSINVKMNLNQDLKFITTGLSLRGLFSWTYAGSNTAIHSKLGRDVFYSRSGERNSDGTLTLIRSVAATSPSYAQNTGINRSLYMEGQLNYNRRFRNVHNVTGLIHYYHQENVTSNVAAYAYPYMSIIPLRYQALSARGTYSYKDIYIFEGNLGYSGSENYKPGEQFGFFPAVSGAWVPTQYKWVQDNLKFLDFFKVRVSWGQVGNSQIIDGGLSVRFPYQTVLSNGSNEWGPTLTETKLGSENLRWQTSTKTNLGVEAKLFNNSIDIIVDFFQTQAKDIYQQRVTLPEEVGAPQPPYLNTGSMKSWGADGTVAYTKNFNNDFSLTVRSNFTLTRNKVTHWEQSGIRFPYQSFTGVPYGVQRGLIALGLFKDEADIASSPSQTFMVDYRPGDIKYKDVNGDGIVNTDDIVPLNYSNVPLVIYGFAGSLNYKKWSFSTLFSLQSKVNYFLGGAGYYPFSDESTGNVLSIVANRNNRWIPASISGNLNTENPDATFPRLTHGANPNNNRASTFWLADASFLRWSNVELNYRWDFGLVKKMGLSAVTFSLLGSNLAVWDKVKLWDPEQASSNGAAYPLQRTFTFQLYVNF